MPPLLYRLEAREIRNLLSILYQQRATINYLNGNLTNAKKDQAASFGYYGNSFDPSRTEGNLLDDPSSLLCALRSHSLRAKYENNELPERRIKRRISVIRNFEPSESTQHFSYLIDSVMSSNLISTELFELLYEAATDLLLKNGYGVSVDIAKLITLRRRWWALHLFFGPSGWQDSLISDFKLWRKTSMFNEIRELECLLHRTQRLVGSEKYRDAEYIVHSHQSV